MSGRSSRSTLMETKLAFMKAAVSSSSKDSRSITWHQWQAEYPTESRIGRSSRRARSSASAPHGYQSTGLSRCWRRYGLVSAARRLAIHPRVTRTTLRASSDSFDRSVNSMNSSGNRDAALQAVLAKLEPADRSVVLGALEEAQKTETELRYLADHDPLTALLNRRAFRTRLDTYVNFAARYGGRGAVMVIDVDGLKGVNDRLGHQQGDNLIRRIAEALRERVRATDIVARLSGDEFAVLMPQSDVEGALQLGEDLRVQVADGFAGDPELAGATISVGITMFGVESDGGAEAVLAAADEAMYRAKAEGRNRVSLFETPVEATLSDAARRLTTSAKIRNAITQNRLSLATQPISSLASGEIERFELLLRMQGESGEILPASAFI